MEVYTPIPDELLHRAPRALGTVLRVAVLALVAAAGLRFAFAAPPADFRNFGVVHTQVGAAEVACGGELTNGCDRTTALVFPSCAPGTAWRVYFDMLGTAIPSATETDASVRRLIGARPPSGTSWDVTCRDRYPLDNRPARLKSD